MEAFELTVRILLPVHSVLGELAAHRYSRTKKKERVKKLGKCVTNPGSTQLLEGQFELARL